MTRPAHRSVRPGSFGAWILAVRPATLPAAVAPVALGCAVANTLGAFAPGPALATLVGAVLLQVLANLSNDLFDHENGADTAERLGPTRVVQSGLLSPGAVRAGVLGTIGLAVGVGSYLAVIAGPLIVVIGIASILAALAYTGGPFPLGYHGLGEVFVVLFFGFVAVCGTAFVLVGHVPALAWWAAIPPGTLASAILVVNNVRDRETDIRAGKRTLAVRWGREAAVLEYHLLLGLAYLAPIVVTAVGLTAWPALAPLTTLPFAVHLATKVAVERGTDLNRRLVGTAQLMLVFALLFAAGIVLGGS